GAVVDGHAGVGVCHGGHVGDRAVPAAAVGLPRGPGDVLRAAAAGAAPDRLAPAPAVAGGLEAGAAHGRHVLGGGRELDAVAAVTRARRDGDAGMVEVGLVVDLVAVLTAAVAVRDGVGAQAGGGV